MTSAIVCSSLTLFLSFSVVLIVGNERANNVCKTFADYYTDLHNNKNCYYNPDMFLHVPEIITRHGYPVKIYTATTQDGYILTMFRIPWGRNSIAQISGPPVLIQHGIGVSSKVFVDIGNKSLAFTLADNGFDVWLGNFRGTEYSNNHLFLKTSDKRYWNFTFHENGIYDLPAQLNVIASESKEKVFYIGYSMGTTAYFIYNTVYPDMARQTIRIAINLAPIAFAHYLETPLRLLVPLWPPIQDIVYDVTGGVVEQRTPERINARKKLCIPSPPQMQACLFIYGLLYGVDADQEDPETLPVILIQDTDSIGIKTLSHYIQFIQSGKFQQFDYGENNVKIYGTSAPPSYNLSKINVPNYFIRGNNDPLATKRNVEETYNALPEIAKPFNIFVIKHDRFTHSAFVTAKDVKELLYDHIVEFMKIDVR